MKIIDNTHPDFENLWRKGEEAMAGATIFYTTMFRRYEQKLFLGKMAFDDSFLIVSPDGEPCALVPLYAFPEANGTFCYRYGPEYLRGPLVSCLSGSRLFGKVIDFAIDTVAVKAKAKNVCAHWVMLEPFEIIEGRQYYNYFLEYNYEDCSGVCNIIDLTPADDALWSNIRKSYRPLISREAKRCLVSIIGRDNYDFQQCEEYRRLHILAAGKETRPPETFYEMYRFIEEGKAFLILVRGQAGEALGAYYFLYHHNYAFYGSAATDPSLSSQSGVGHLGLWSGISFAKKQGCRFLDLGQLLIRPGGVTEKEKNIFLFKTGFGGRKVVVFRAAKNFTLPDKNENTKKDKD